MSYSPIRDYALLGDCHGSALVSREGSVDWCCLGRFDADPTFCRVLDANKGGFFSLQPTGDFRAARSYLADTNVLRTTFSTASGALSLTDFMPVGRKPGAAVHDYVTLDAPGWLVRVARCEAGEVDLHVRFRPSVEFARRPTELRRMAHGIGVHDGPFLQSDLPLSIEHDVAEATVAMRVGERHVFVVSPQPMAGPVSAGAIQRLLQITTAFWEEWLQYCRYKGPYADAVRRSALTLKALTYAPSGAIVAAPTCSLPEAIGGPRNWDYRYCWPRDVTFTLFALGSLGYSGEARRFGEYLYQSCQTTHPRVQIMYGIGKETELEEQKLEHLEGYRGSRPVNTGNGAYRQVQLDVYGEVLDWAHLYRSLGERFPKDAREMLASMAEHVCQTWQQPDHGLWEMRGPPQHHVFGKMMSWAAADRAMQMFGETDALRESRERMRRTILEEGVHQGRLVQIFGADHADAALLLTPMIGFPSGAPILKATVDDVQHKLRVGDYVRRYVCDDGLAGQEDAFLVCSFWLVDALLALDRAEEARGLYERLLE